MAERTQTQQSELENTAKHYPHIHFINRVRIIDEEASDFEKNVSRAKWESWYAHEEPGSYYSNLNDCV